MSRPSGTAPLYVRFTDTSTGNPTSWRWDFSSLAWSSSRNPSVLFRQPGSYAVTLTARNAYGWSQLTKNLTVTGGLPMSGKGDAIGIVG
jgi:PKD repeat protein